MHVLPAKVKVPLVHVPVDDLLQASPDEPNKETGWSFDRPVALIGSIRSMGSRRMAPNVPSIRVDHHTNFGGRFNATTNNR